MLSGFSLESNEPFVPILSRRRTEAQKLIEETRQQQQQTQLDIALSRHQEAMRRFRNRLPGPVTITIETPSATIPLSPSIGKFSLN